MLCCSPNLSITFPSLCSFPQADAIERTKRKEEYRRIQTMRAIEEREARSKELQVRFYNFFFFLSSLLNHPCSKATRNTP